MRRLPLFLLLLPACSDFGSTALVVRVPDVRADLVDRETFRSKVLDVDGDGLVDLVTFAYDDDAIGVSRGLADGGFDSEERWPLPANVRFLRDRFAWRGFRDHNGDGIADILAAEPSGSELVFTFYRGRDGSFAAGERWGVLPADGEPTDIDGDGLTDWVRRGDSANANYPAFGDANGWYWRVWLGGPTNFATSAIDWPVPDKFTLTVGDWDGDGRHDAIAWDGESDTPYAPVTNADGASVIALYPGSTTGFATDAVEWTAPASFSAQVGTEYRTLDLNCDDRVDLLERVDREGAWLTAMELWTNTGSGFSAATNLNLTVPEDLEGSVRPVFVDLTGDGCRDLVYTTVDGAETLGGESDPQWWVYPG